MTERSWYWGGTAVGDAALPAPYGAPYTDDMFSDLWARLHTNDRTSMGVIYQNLAPYSGHLEVTATGNPGEISVAAGFGMCDGKVYQNDSALVIGGIADGQHYVVMRKTWAAQTVRLAVIPLVGAFTQTDGVMWDVALATLNVVAGVVTVSDYREFCYSGEPTTAPPPPGMVLINFANIVAAGDTVDFDLIPQDYRDLLITYSARATAFGGGISDIPIRAVLNSDTQDTHYYDNIRYEPGGSPAVPFDYPYGTVRIPTGGMIVGVSNPDNDPAGLFSDGEFWVYSYTRTKAFGVKGTGVNPDSRTLVFTHAGFDPTRGAPVQPLAPITRIQITTTDNTGSGDYGFAVGSRFALYGTPAS